MSSTTWGKVMHRTLISPGFVLVLTSLIFAVVAVSTFRYDPGFMTMPDVWASAATIAALAAGIAAVHPNRTSIMVAGSVGMTVALSRSFALAYEVTFRVHDGNQQAGYLTGCAVWGGFGLLMYVVWSHVMVPWSALNRHRAAEKK